MAKLGTARIMAVTDGKAAFPGAGNLEDLRRIGGETGCRTTLVGTLRWIGGKRRISLRLRDVETGYSLFEWVTYPNSTKPLASEVAAYIASDLFTAIGESP